MFCSVFHSGGLSMAHHLLLPFPVWINICLIYLFFWVKRSESGRSDWCEKAGCRSHPSPKSSQFGLHLCEWSLKRPQINICCVKVSVNSHWFHSANVFFPSVRVLIWSKIFNNFYLETFGRIKQEKKKSLFGLKKMFDHGLDASFSLWG